MKKIVLIALASMMSLSVMADQCAYITKEQAKEALKIAIDANKVESLCEPCGETQAKELEVKSIGISDVDYEGYWELQINGSGVDLAYTYVNGMNLAKLSACEATGVSETIGK